MHSHAPITELVLWLIHYLRTSSPYCGVLICISVHAPAKLATALHCISLSAVDAQPTYEAILTATDEKTSISTHGNVLGCTWLGKCSIRDKLADSHVRMVDSWPPPWLAVEVNSPTGLPTSAPFDHRLPVASQNALNWAHIVPYLCTPGPIYIHIHSDIVCSQFTTVNRKSYALSWYDKK